MSQNIRSLRADYVPTDSPEEDFRRAMCASGLPPPERIVGDGALHRFSTNGKSSDAAGWYVLHLDGIPAGAYGCWRGDISATWCAKADREMTPPERAQHAKRLAEMREARESEQDARRAAAAAQAAAMWEAARPAPASHAYLQRKGVAPHGLREHSDGRLLVPIYNDARELVSLQFIGPDGGKRFLTGGLTGGCFFLIGKPDRVLCVAEGFATAATIHEATGHAVAIAFNATNLPAVARSLRNRHPSAQLVICADDDAATTGNPGMAKAREAASAVAGLLAVPAFGPDRPAAATDFNDLQKHRGRDAVAACIDLASPAPAPAMPTGGPKAPDLRTAADVAAVLPRSEWTLPPYLERKALAVLYGDFGTFKSFIALDWCVRTAMGMAAIGGTSSRDPAPVILISAEGRGMAKRLRAWCRHAFPERGWRDVLAGVPLHIIEHPVNLSDAANVAALVGAVRALGIEPALIVVDTLARNSNGEVEASTADASAYLANLDQYLRAEFGSTVLLVHHVGHADKGRIRGPIVIAANTDALIRVDRAPGEMQVNVTVERLKDSEPPAPVSLRAVVVDLMELDEDRRPITSLALEDGGPVVVKRAEPGGKHPPVLLAGLREWAREHPAQTHITHADLGDICKAQGIPRQRKQAAVESLRSAGYLVPAVGGFRLEV